jgi:transposase InsO family protein
MTDNGSCYKAFDFRDDCRELGLRHVHTRPYAPTTLAHTRGGGVWSTMDASPRRWRKLVAKSV